MASETPFPFLVVSLFCQVTQWEAATKEVEGQVADESNSLSAMIKGLETHRSELCCQLEVSSMIPSMMIYVLIPGLITQTVRFLSTVR